MCGGQRRAFQQEEIIMDGMKNISKAEVLTLRDQVAYQSGQVVSRTLAQNEHVSVTLFSFDKGEEISIPAATAEPITPEILLDIRYK